MLGPLQVRANGRDVEIRAGLSRTLLIALAVRAPEAVSAGTLIDVLWGDAQPRNPANALQIQVSYLRRALAADDGTAQPIVTRPGGYALEVNAEAIDAVRFERLVAAAQVSPFDSSDPDGAAAVLRQLDEALAMWRGDALADAGSEPSLQPFAVRLEELRWQAHELRNDVLLALGRHAHVVGAAGALVADQPLRERLHEQLMVALYRCGRQADALRAYEAARKLLIEELGINPGPGLQALEQRILRQDPSLDWLPPAGTARDTVAAGASGEASADVAALPIEMRLAALPVPPTPLIGREAETARVGELLARTRLVTLTGPGGAGKTRLAIDVARRAGLDKVWFVDLSTVDLPELVAPSVAASLGATTGPADDPVDVVASALATEAGLVVLDTCEHVLTGAAAVASAIVRRAEGIKVLATSRRALGISGEAAWPVPPLAVGAGGEASFDDIAASPAVVLFCERARFVRPDFELTPENAHDVAEICLALDGLPLAIELAAGRTDVLTPSAMRERLRHRFDLLVDGASDAALRQQTLRGAIDWSVELLSEDQRTFFARLGAFAGTFDLEAAENVAGHDLSDPLALLAALVRHSMVSPDGAGRFRLLDTVRAYAEELLADLDADETRQRHAQHYTQTAERSELVLRGDDQVVALTTLRRELPNFNAALEWSLTVGDVSVAARLAGALAWFWALDGRLDAADRHLRRALMIENAPAEIQAKVLWGYSLLVAALGDPREALRAADESVVRAREANDASTLGAALNAVAVAQFAVGDLVASADTHEAAIIAFQTAGDVWGEAICRVLRARTALDAGDPDGEPRLFAALDVARRAGDAHVIGIGLGLLAQVRADHGDGLGAIEAASESLSLQEHIGYAEGTVYALHLLARLHAAAGDCAAARASLLRGLSLAWKMQHTAAICEALEDLAQLLAVDDRDAAAELLELALAERNRRGLPPRAGDRVAIEKLRADLGVPGLHPAADLAATVGRLLR